MKPAAPAYVCFDADISGHPLSLPANCIRPGVIRVSVALDAQNSKYGDYQMDNPITFFGWFAFAIVAFVAFSTILGSFFTVNTAQVAVITRFGRFLRVPPIRA